MAKVGQGMVPSWRAAEPLKAGFAGLGAFTQAKGRVLFHTSMRPDTEEERKDKALAIMDSHVRAWSSTA